MKNIVTIDFDVIMAPSIDLYNHFVPLERTWDELNHIPQLRLSDGDYRHYQRLTEWLVDMSTVLNKEQIHFIGSHEFILKYLDSNDKYNIINIDHHHDCGYDDDNSIYKTSDIDCTNWVATAYDQGLIEKYTWLKNTNSTFVSVKAKEIVTNHYNLSDFNLNILTPPDEIYICFSENWIPPNIRPLYFTWMDILNKIYNTTFEID